jgi:lysophospholipase L1-like esterase
VRRLRRLLYAVVPVLVLVGVAEGLARAFPPPAPGSFARPDGGGIMLQGNPLLAWELRPGRRMEDGHSVRVNVKGFRDKDRAPKGDNARVLSLGDSSVYGFGVDDGQVFTSLLEADTGAEFINGGVPGYSTEQALNLLSLRGFALRPDVLLVATLWSDSNFDRFVDREILARARGAELRWSVSGWSAALGWVESWAARRGQEELAKVGWMTDDKAHGERRVPLGDYAANLALLCTRMAERGGGVLFVVLPGQDDVVDAVPSPEPWSVYRETMRRTATACGAPLVDAAAVFAERGDPALMVDTVHPSAAGHALLAEAIAAELDAHGWPGTPLTARATDPVVVPEDPFATSGDTLFQGMRGPLQAPGEHRPPPGPRRR